MSQKKKRTKNKIHDSEKINKQDNDILDENQIDDDYLDNEELIKISKEPKDIKRDIYIPRDKLFEPIGILDPNGDNVNPLTNQPYQNLYADDNNQNTYQQMAKFWTIFPMYDIRKKALEQIYDNQVILVVSGTGSGKTVLTPKYVLHTLNYQGRIAITNPKRIPSNSNAEFAAKNLDVKIGDQVGLKYRNSDKSQYSNNSKLVYCTDGYILGKLKSNPLLLDYDCVIIDEAHERGVNIDLLLLKLKQLVIKRPKFKLVIMSATISQKIFEDYFPSNKFKFTVINGGQTPKEPVTEIFLDQIPFLKNKLVYNTHTKNSIIQSNGELNINDDNLYLDPMIDIIINIIQNEQPGDILAFVGGKGSGNKGVELLKQKLNQIDEELKKKIFFGVLSGSTEKKTSELIVHASKYKLENPLLNRKVIFSTEVAESSVTIDGLVFVIDSGIVHSSRYYSESNLDALEKRFIPKSSHKQRLGRVGRTIPGTCYNLFTKDQYEKLFPSYATSPIFLENISDFILNFICNYCNYVITPFKYPSYNKLTDSKLYYQTNSENDKLELSELLYELIEPPKEDTIKAILSRLQALDCLNIKDKKGYPSIIGEAISSLGTTPELGRLLVSSYNYGYMKQFNWFLNFYDRFECKFDKIFNSIDIIKNRYMKENNLKEITEKQLNNLKFKFIKKIVDFKSDFGDIVTFINILNQYVSVKKKFKDLEINKDEYEKWIKDNYLSGSNLDEIISNNRNSYSSKLLQFIDNYKKKHHKIKRTEVFKNDKILLDISDNDNENFLKIIFDSLLINLSYQLDKNSNYYNCFPQIPLDGKFPDNRKSIDSFVTLKSTNNLSPYIIYNSFTSIFGKRKFNMINIIPVSIIRTTVKQVNKDLDDNKINSKYPVLLQYSKLTSKIEDYKKSIESKNKKDQNKEVSNNITKTISKKKKLSKKKPLINKNKIDNTESQKNSKKNSTNKKSTGKIKE